MRFVDRNTFVSLPSGTLYCKCRDQNFEPLSVKYDTLPNSNLPDWVCAELTVPETEDYHELLEAFADGKSRPLNTAAGRDGLFEARDMFVIYEKPDLLDLKVLIDAALLVAGPLQE